MLTPYTSDCQKSPKFLRRIDIPRTSLAYEHVHVHMCAAKIFPELAQVSLFAG